MEKTTKKHHVNLFGRTAWEAFEPEKMENGGYPLVGALINGELCGLNQPISFESEIEAVYLNSIKGMLLYRNALSFLLLQAWYASLQECGNESGDESQEPQRSSWQELGSLTIGPTMGSGFYCYFDGDISAELLLALKRQMQDWIAADLPITLNYISYTAAQELYGGKAEWREYLSLSNQNRIPVYSLGPFRFSSPRVEPCLHRLGLLQKFDLTKNGEGFLLHFPRHSRPFSLDGEAVYAPKLLDMYRQYKEWNRNVGVYNVAALVARTEQKNGIDKLITLSEIHQQKIMGHIADSVLAKKTARLLLIAGPSSSGKTTFTKKLALQLEILGYRTVIVSLDDFYLGKDYPTPKGPDGKPDLECLEALNLERLSRNLSELLSGQKVEFPLFDFAAGRTKETGRWLQMSGNTILMMEGIHGLNPMLTPDIPKEQKFHVYISALTQLNILPSLRMPTSDNRLLRRIVRDYRFRGHSAHETLAMWDSVQRGERQHIFPHQNKADAVFNSVLEYEIPILKTYAAPLLKQVKPDQATYATAKHLENILSFFPSLSSSPVPKDSILREFIGGSSFHY
ncbi:MAG: nucleoside kinase [Spirochaetota bacterium]